MKDSYDLILQIEADLEANEKASEVEFWNDKCAIYDLKTGNFDEAQMEMSILKEEIQQVFANYGVI